MKTLTIILTLALTSLAHAAGEKYFVIGETISVSVTVATGTPPFTYQWRKDGVDIPGAVNKDYNISSASALDAGLYSVKVANKAGETISDNAAAYIIVKPAGLVTTFNQPTTQPAAQPATN